MIDKKSKWMNHFFTLVAVKQFAFIIILVLALPALLFLSVSLLLTGILLIPSALIFCAPIAIQHIKRYYDGKEVSDE